MGIISAVKRWWNSLFSKQSIEDYFGVKVALTPLMQQKQELYRRIARGLAPWNDEDTPSLMLASSISAEIARKVTIGLESEIFGGETENTDENGNAVKERLTNPRAEYLNEQYKKVKEKLRTAVVSACNGGEIILKTYIAPDGPEVRISETDCYFPIAYNAKDELVSVIFGASIERDKWLYKLLEHHEFNEANKTHTIAYAAFKSEREQHGYRQEGLGRKIELSEVPEWAHLSDVTIQNIEKPLFVLFKMPSSDTVETPQRQGLPIWSKAVEMLRKADQQEARTDWEFEGGELAIDAPLDWFKLGADGKPILPKSKERLFRTFDNPGNFDKAVQAQVFSPVFRIDGLNSRMNQILRRIEFLCGVSYGIISDVNEQEKTATEVLSSKDRFFTTVSDIQQALQKALEHLVYSFGVLADLQGIPQGNYEMSFTWDDSIMADRQREFDERMKLVALNVMSRQEFRAWWLGVDPDSEEARNLPETLEDEFGV